MFTVVDDAENKVQNKMHALIRSQLSTFFIMLIDSTQGQNNYNKCVDTKVAEQWHDEDLMSFVKR